MARADLVSVERIGNLVHPTYPEDATVITERLSLKPSLSRFMRPDGKHQLYAVGLRRVSAAEQGNRGLGLEAQRASVRLSAATQGWTLSFPTSPAARSIAVPDFRRP